ncbi:hypothetical protein Fot_13651 [Forsythia ovata]|uniref:Uncharacterized protein n=1 Tax=Forsythia ovata TaxID=205694 RepID=A0ABD1W690_9LAMI
MDEHTYWAHFQQWSFRESLGSSNRGLISTDRAPNTGGVFPIGRRTERFARFRQKSTRTKRAIKKISKDRPLLPHKLAGEIMANEIVNYGARSKETGREKSHLNA